jgi:serine/threonine protein kinase/FixJ family two-component response regulator
MSQAKSILLQVETRVVLVADDHSERAELIRLQLQRVGYEVLLAPDGLQAFSMLQSTAVDAVFANISLPQMGGLELLRVLRQDKDLLNTALLLFAEQASSEDIAEAFQLGADDFVLTPLEFTILRARLAARIKDKAQRKNVDPAPEPMLLAGSVLANRYRLDERIGDGSFGAVYKATHIDLRRQVAIKVLQTKHLPEKEALLRFRLEGIAASRLPHPNIVNIYDYGITPEGLAFLVMEFLNGKPLSRHLDQKAHTPERCIEIALPISDAIAFAHQNRVIHRDVKPENIYLHNSQFGEVPKLIDFGLVKLGATAEDTGDAITTLRGHVLGTVSYMAPERFREKPYTGLVDVYGLGITMYEILTGRPPYASKKAPIEIAKAHLYDKIPSIRERFPYVPIELENLVLATLEKDPQKRPSALEVAQRLFSLHSSQRSAPYSVHINAQDPSNPMQINAHQMPTVLFQHNAFRDEPTIQLDQEELLSLDEVYENNEAQPTKSDEQ